MSFPARSRRKWPEDSASEQRYRDIVEAQTDLICRFLPDTTLTFVNDAYCRFFKKSSGELIGSQFIEFVPERHRADVTVHIATVVATRRRATYGHAVPGADGGLSWQEWTADVVLDDAGRVVELQAIGRDATDHHRSAEALDQSHARNQALLRALPDMMFVLATDGTYLDYHAPDPAMLLLPPEQFLGRRMDDVLPPDLAATFHRAFAELRDTGQPAVVEYPLAIPSGTRFFEARLVGYQDGRRVLTIVRDVTERRQAEDAVRRAQSDAANAARLSWMGALTASLAHDINQPLAAIEANAGVGLHWLDSSPATSHEPVRESLVDIADAAQRATAIIQRTLDLFSRRPLGRGPVHPCELVDGALAATEAVLRRSGITVSTNVSVELPHVHADRAMLLQVLISLVSNAVDAMRPAATRSLFVDSSHNDGFVHLAIEDTGPGFDPVNAEALFTPFRTTKPGHIGIGLSIGRAIVEAHGGMLRALPTGQPGARFEMSLPALPAGVGTPASPAENN